MANDPPFATLNHFIADLGIPEESPNPRVGISLTRRGFRFPQYIRWVWIFSYQQNADPAGDLLWSRTKFRYLLLDEQKEITTIHRTGHHYRRLDSRSPNWAPCL